MKIDLTHLLDIEIIITHKKLLVKYQLCLDAVLLIVMHQYHATQQIQQPIEVKNTNDNHIENDEVRTNNNVEGDNLKTKFYCGAANPNMDKAVKLLKTFETTAEATYKNAMITLMM